MLGPRVCGLARGRGAGEKATIGAGGETADALDAEDRSVVAVMAPIPGPDWMAFVEQPASEVPPDPGSAVADGSVAARRRRFRRPSGFPPCPPYGPPIRLLEQGAERTG